MVWPTRVRWFCRGNSNGDAKSCVSLHRTKGSKDKALTYWSYPFSQFHQLRIRTAFAGARCANSPTTHQQDEVLVDTFYQSDVAAWFSKECPISMRFDKNHRNWQWRKRCSTFNEFKSESVQRLMRLFLRSTAFLVSKYIPQMVSIVSTQLAKA